MDVVVVGSGGREQALAEVLARTATVQVTPGNVGVSGSTTTPATELDADLFVIGPEQPLVDGLADDLRAQGKTVFGPGRDGARLEGSKAWMKEVLVDAGVATARHAAFTADQLEPALAYLEAMAGLYVIKTDGLAAGKGVVVTESIVEARDAVREYLSGAAFGAAGTTCVIEEGLTGPELSIFAACDGRTAIPFGSAQDYKRIGEGDTGPNTGGMGTFSPVPAGNPAMIGHVIDTAIEPTLATLRDRGIDYRGFLYAGLMLTPDGPKMLEYNIRFGDPEAQVVLPRLTSDLAVHLHEAASGAITTQPTFSDDAVVCVVIAAEGYPQSPRTGDRIEGVEDARSIDGVTVYGVGIAEADDGGWQTAGGRVINVMGRGATLAEARQKAYAGVDRISWPGAYARRDIAAGPE
jgi:phosphoribosylamine---glycine ligase